GRVSWPDRSAAARRSRDGASFRYAASRNGPKRGTGQRLRWAVSVWSPPPESNRRPHPYHGCALPTELGGLVVPGGMVHGLDRCCPAGAYGRDAASATIWTALRTRVRGGGGRTASPGVVAGRRTRSAVQPGVRPWAGRPR